MDRIRSKPGAFQFIVTILTIFISGITLNAQKTKWAPTNREVVIPYPDSTVRAYILIEDVEFTPLDGLEYFW